jgi:hypothetical protein
MKKLSKEAQSALLAASNRPGSLIQGSDAVLQELHAAGMSSDRDNITHAGRQARQSILDARLDEAFG